MFKDKTVRKTLLGKTGKWDDDFEIRTTTITFPSDGVQPERVIKYRADDGLIHYLLTRIEALEDKLKSKPHLKAKE